MKRDSKQVRIDHDLFRFLKTEAASQSVMHDEYTTMSDVIRNAIIKQYGNAAIDKVQPPTTTTKRSKK